uniref:NAD(P)-binding domain-containing protein n=1 Tax=Pyrodinium bahamense TaxID=73915 RepID=A0A7S0AG11_9DINO
MVAVIGSTGKLGRHAVQQLVERGYSVRCLVRQDPVGTNPCCAPSATSAEVAAWLAAMPGVQLVRGDITDRESIFELLRGCLVCLVLHGATRRTELSDLLPWVDPTQDPTHAMRVNYEGVRHVIEAACASGSCQRIVRVTGKGEDPWSMFSILINGLGSMAKAWNYEGERLLRACDDVDYTIVRPGVMGQGDERLRGASLALADNGGDLQVSPIPHRCVAELCVRCLEFPNSARSTLCAMTVPEGKGEESFEPLLEKVSPDTRSFPGRELFQRHVLAVRVGGPALAGLALGFLAGALGLLRELAMTLVVRPQ